MSRITAISIPTAILLLAAASQGDALAVSPMQPASTDVNRAVVHFADLDLNQPAGVASLYRRIRRAADNVCGERRRAGSQFVSEDWNLCVRQAVDRAVLALDRPTLNAYHRAHTLPFYRRTTTAQAFVARPY